MDKKDRIVISTLAVLAIFIWLRDIAWMTSSDDTLPILVAIPLFIWLGQPWSFRKNVMPLAPKCTVISILLFLTGIALDLTILLALGWTYLLWNWLYVRTPIEFHSKLKKLLILPIMAFPWVTLDAEQLGWWFRLSGAWTAAHFFHLAGFSVIYEGTNLMINKIPISVEAACSGLSTLQSMLIAGSAVNYMILGKTRRYWGNIPLLFAMAWLANTLRIITLCSAAIWISPEFALGPFHTWGGWLVLVLMFGLCWFIFSLQEPKSAKAT